MITREALEAHVQTIQLQIAGYQGALQLAEQLLRELDTDGAGDMTVGDLAEAIAGPGASAEVSPVNGQDP